MGSGTGNRLGETLRGLRQAAGLTQEELAERAGISARAVSDTERGLRSAVHADTARRLAAALGLAGEARDAFDALARGRPAGEPAPRASGLPEVPTPLLGRSGELRAISAALTGRAVRLLTLTGPGGIGKTRLAVEAARRAQASFSGGVYFVSLGEVRDAALVVPEVAKAIGAPEMGAELPELLANRLHGTRALIVLDTFEHLTAAAPQVYAAMLGCPETTFLVTSRSALRLRGEQQFPVPPLELPAGTDGVSPERLARWPATALFWDRALAVRPDLPLDTPAAVLVAEICRRLDGLPLAIELAAARVRHLPLAAVRDQLTDRLRLLVGGTLDLPRRQRTIRDTVAWSHGLLDPPAATLFRRLAVFSGGWELASAGAVCGETGAAAGALEGISVLVDQSLVTLDHAHPHGRYDMLDVVRGYAADRLAEAGEADQLSRRHAVHYLALAEEAEPRLVRAGHQKWFQRLDAERGNFRRAMTWAIDCGETVLALRYAAALWRYWRQLGEFTEGRRWTESALSLPGDAPAPLRARALQAAAALAFPQGDYQRLAALVSEATDLARQSEDPLDMRNALTIAGFVAVGQGRYQDALGAFAECVAICRRLGPSWQLATSQLNFGVTLLRAGRAADADAAFADGLRIYRELGDDVFAARMTSQRAQAALARREIDRAAGLARDALAEFAAHGERQGIAEGLETLAAVAVARSDPGRAATLAGAAAAIRETIAATPLPDLIIASRLLREAERAAGPEEWRASWRSGRALSAAEAVSYALDGPA